LPVVPGIFIPRSLAPDRPEGLYIFICAGILRRQSHPLLSAKFESLAQPRLQEIIEDTARQCGVRLSGNIYWIPKPNAQAMMVGGWLGLGAKPAIAIGLPQLRVLSVDELRATLAHEFHHLRRGDAFLFGCVFNARRVAEAIAEGFQTHPQILSGFFFTAYSSFLWRLSMPIVRNWEFEADSFAARTVTPASLARALVKLDFAQSRFDAFRRNWLEPALESGYAPPVMRGFWEYYEHCALQERSHGWLIVAREVNRQSETHPPLRERLLRLAQLDNSPAPASDEPAFLLFDGPDQVEATVYPPKAGARAETAWSTEVLQKLMALWEKEVLAATPRRQGAVDVNSLPKLCSSLPYAATYLGYEKKESDAVERILMKAFAVALNNTGWAPVLERGRLLFRRDSFALDTAAELRRLKMRQAPDWRSRCEEWNISGLLLLPELESEPQSLRRGRFCSHCLRSFRKPVERCPVCHKSL
jgi:Zn-dependent protease with chaperone function